AREDRVARQVAGFWGSFAQDYQVLSAQAQAFHERFANLLGAGAAAYLDTEVAGAAQLMSQAGGAAAGLALPAAAVLSPGASTLATIEGPYQTLFANTAANLQALDALWSANPAPFLKQLINNADCYA